MTEKPPAPRWEDDYRNWLTELKQRWSGHVRVFRDGAKCRLGGTESVDRRGNADCRCYNPEVHCGQRVQERG